jgi:hypothetical protein
MSPGADRAVGREVERRAIQAGDVEREHVDVAGQAVAGRDGSVVGRAAVGGGGVAVHRRRVAAGELAGVAEVARAGEEDDAGATVPLDRLVELVPAGRGRDRVDQHGRIVRGDEVRPHRPLPAAPGRPGGVVGAPCGEPGRALLQHARAHAPGFATAPPRPSSRGSMSARRATRSPVV